MAEQAKKTYVGNGWQNQWGLSISINREAFLKLPVNDKGMVSIYAGSRRNGPDEKTKSTHWVAWSDYKGAKKEIDNNGTSDEF